MQYIIASIGRSGSTLITDLISQVTGLPISFVSDLKFPKSQILKTHIHFRTEPDYDYRAIFIYSKDIVDVISSMNSGRMDLKKHLKHLEVLKRHRLLFGLAVKISKILIFKKLIASVEMFAISYMIKNDKFRFKENALSWKASHNTLFVAYEDLCESKDLELLRISRFLGISLPDFEVRNRKAKEDSSRGALIDLALTEYKDFFNSLSGIKTSNK